VAKEKGWKIDQEGFEEFLEFQREQSKDTWKGSGDLLVPNQVRTWTHQPTFVGYSQNSVESAKLVHFTEPSADGTWRKREKNHSDTLCH